MQIWCSTTSVRLPGRRGPAIEAPSGGGDVARAELEVDPCGPRDRPVDRPGSDRSRSGEVVVRHEEPGAQRCLVALEQRSRHRARRRCPERRQRFDRTVGDRRQAGGQESLQVVIGRTATALDPRCGLPEAARRESDVMPFDPDEAQCAEGARCRDVVGHSSDRRCVQGGVGQTSCIAEVAEPCLDQRHRAEGVDPPDDVLHAGQPGGASESAPAGGDRLVEELAQRGRELGHQHDGLPATDPEEVDDLLVVEERQRVQRRGCRRDGLGPREVVQHETRVEGVGGGSFAPTQVGASTEPTMGLRGTDVLL